MSVTPTNTDLESIPEVPTPALESASQSIDGAGHHAFEALLAFSALHQQIRLRQAHGYRGEDSLSREDSQQVEQFVLDEVLQLVAERALAMTGADGIAIALAEGSAIICRACAGNIAPDHGMRVDPGSGFSGACLVSGKIVRCDDTEFDPQVNALACRRLGARSMVAVPLSAKRTVIGLVEAFSTEPYGFNDSDVRGLSLLAELILAALRPEEEDRFAEVSQRVVRPKEEVSTATELTNSDEITPRETPDEIPGEKDSTGDSLPSKTGSNFRPGLGIVIGLVLFALALGAGLWWTMSHLANSKITVRQPAAPATRVPAPAAENASAAPPSTGQPTILEDESLGKPATAAQLATLPEVTGIRHWSTAESSTVVIDLQDQVQYEAHRLTNPERIYFDLHDTRLAAELFGKSLEIGDTLVQRVRVAQPIPGITRVVLETKGASNFSVSLEASPYRLVVEIRKVGATPEPRSKVNLFAPLDQSAAAVGRPARDLTPRLRIVLDAGHGGGDLGTVGKQGLLEKDLVLDIANRLGALLERRLGAQVIYTRKDDSYIALEKRTEMANLSEADLFLSIHANYSDYPSARGIETYYTNTYSSIKARSSEDAQAEPALQNVNWTNVDIRRKVRESHRFAASIQHALYATLAKKNPGLPNRGVKQAQYAVLTGTTMPAILTEISFVSSPSDENSLQSASYRQQIAEALYQGVAHYTEQSGRVKMASASGKPGGH
jgi:N-acetylmuramoyl-L-alanine amidase/putative methionine-R-sulfoxide reductase with GAF domain